MASNRDLQHRPVHGGDLQGTSARAIEAEIKRAKYKCSVESGKPDYHYWRHRLAVLLNAAKRYRPLAQHEQARIDAEQQWEPFESLAQRLDTALFG